jgi:hypothetical protein
LRGRRSEVRTRSAEQFIGLPATIGAEAVVIGLVQFAVNAELGHLFAPPKLKRIPTRKHDIAATLIELVHTVGIDLRVRGEIAAIAPRHQHERQVVPVVVNVQTAPLLGLALRQAHPAAPQGVPLFSQNDTELMRRDSHARIISILRPDRQRS